MDRGYHWWLSSYRRYKFDLLFQLGGKGRILGSITGESLCKVSQLLNYYNSNTVTKNKGEYGRQISQSHIIIVNMASKFRNLWIWPANIAITDYNREYDQQISQSVNVASKYRNHRLESWMWPANIAICEYVIVIMAGKYRNQRL